jgi:hypothetical protein
MGRHHSSSGYWRWPGQRCRAGNGVVRGAADKSLEPTRLSRAVLRFGLPLVPSGSRLVSLHQQPGAYAPAGRLPLKLHFAEDYL